jgi:hypothetical protein
MNTAKKIGAIVAVVIIVSLIAATFTIIYVESFINGHLTSW